LRFFQGLKRRPKVLIVEKAGSGIDGLITTLRDRIDAEVFETDAKEFSGYHSA
jgi:hypothetical protein